MLYVCFTYSPDAPLLHLSARRIAQLDPDAQIVAVSDPDHPLADSDIPPNVLHRVGSFPRNGNLNGLDCIVGMLSTMGDLLEEFDADHIVKFDSDMWPNNLSAFLHSTDADSYDYLATERWHFDQPAGYIYRLSRRLVSRLLTEIEKRREFNLFPPNNKYPEDLTIYALTRQLRAAAAIIPFTSGASSGLISCDPDNLTAAAAADVVHAGEPLPDGSRAPRLLVLGRMTALAHHVGAL